MNYTDCAIEFLVTHSEWRYNARSPASAEPAAYAALALAAFGKESAADRARQWLIDAQWDDGHVGIRQSESEPGWPTALAILAWQPVSQSAQPARSVPAAPAGSSADRFASATRRAVAWLLNIAGETSDRQPYTGHDTTLAGWPWVVGTHSWLEPTAMSVLALKARHLHEHPRTKEAIRLIEDRLLGGGGCNYGNTVVLGQELLPHVQPTGLALLALAGEPDRTRRLAKAISYLESTLGPNTTSASLAYGVLGLAAHGRELPDADAWLARCVAASLRRGSAYELALLSLASLQKQSPLITVAEPAVAV